MRIAITGGIGEGKSTVLGYLADLGHPVASADEIARQVWDDPEFQERVGVLVARRAISRDEMRRLIGADPAVRTQLNRILHPEIERRLNAVEAEFIEVPLLIETCLQGQYDRIWVVTCGPEEQRKRLMTRYGVAGQVGALLATQLPTSVKTAFSDRIVRTNGPESSVRDDVAALVRDEFSR